MTTPPTWRDLGRRAKQLGLLLDHGDHEAQILSRFEPGKSFAVQEADFRSFIGRRRDALILRTAVAAALEQLERPTRRGRTR